MKSTSFTQINFSLVSVKATVALLVTPVWPENNCSLTQCPTRTKDVHHIMEYPLPLKSILYGKMVNAVNCSALADNSDCQRPVDNFGTSGGRRHVHTLWCSTMQLQIEIRNPRF